METSSNKKIMADGVCFESSRCKTVSPKGLRSACFLTILFLSYNVYYGHSAETPLNTGIKARYSNDSKYYVNKRSDEFFNKVVDAIYKAEGSEKAIKPFGILSVPCSTYSQCRKICFNTVKNSYKRWQSAGNPGDFLSFLASRYAPVGAGNDPRKLNRYWLKNVQFHLYGGAL